MKAGKVIIKIKKETDEIAEIDFRKNGKSFFCMDFVFNECVAKSFAENLERILVTPEGFGTCLTLIHPGGEHVLVDLSDNKEELNALNIEKTAELKSAYLLHLMITYPENEGPLIYQTYKDRIVYKAEFISEFYKAIIEQEPGAKSELIESILENGNLDSFYEKISEL